MTGAAARPLLLLLFALQEREKYNNLAQAGKPAGSASKSSSGGSSSGKPSYLDMAMIAIKGLKNTTEQNIKKHTKF